MDMCNSPKQVQPIDNGTNSMTKDTDQKQLESLNESKQTHNTSPNKTSTKPGIL